MGRLKRDDAKPAAFFFFSNVSTGLPDNVLAKSISAYIIAETLQRVLAIFHPFSIQTGRFPIYSQGAILNEG